MKFDNCSACQERALVERIGLSSQHLCAVCADLALACAADRADDGDDCEAEIDELREALEELNR
jgi:hypothetical protein